MSTRNIPYPDDFDDNYHADLQWRRQEMALKALTVSDVLATVDELIAAEADETQHPCHGLVAAALGQTMQPGSAEGLWARCKRLVDHAVEQLVEERLSNPASWEVD
jgi:hypothetical protein